MMLTVVLVGAIAAATPFRADQLEVPGTLEQTEVPETMRALGVPVRLRAVRSKEKPRALIEHFQRAFERAGLFVPGSEELHSAGKLAQVTGYDIENQNSCSVLLQPNLDGTTTVVIGEAFLHARRKEAPASAFAPVFPGATGLVVADLEIGQSLSYGANATDAELWSFYRATLGAAGYKEVSVGQFEALQARIRIWLKPHPGEPTGVVVIRSGR